MIKGSKGSYVAGVSFLATIIVIVGFICSLFFGYVLNVVKLTQCDFEPSYKAEFCRTIGVFIPPVGVIEGYLTIKDGQSEK